MWHLELCWVQSSGHTISSLLCIPHITCTRGSHHTLRLRSGIFYTSTHIKKPPLTGVFSSMLSYIVGQRENNRKEMHWEEKWVVCRTEFFFQLSLKSRTILQWSCLISLHQLTTILWTTASPPNKHLHLFHEHSLVWVFSGFYRVFVMVFFSSGCCVGLWWFFQFGWLFNPVK